MPVYFNSTIEVGLHNSRVLNLLIAAGAAAVASSESDMGSRNCNRPSTSLKESERFTQIYHKLLSCTLE